MEIQCDCGEFKAEIKNFPKETPGRLGCYCDDCQAYAVYLGRTDILDQSGCTEVVPVYPSNFVFKQGIEKLKCTRLFENGTCRWSTTCCNSPIANTKIGMPWAGVFASAYLQKNKNYLENTFGPIKSRIMGKFAKGSPAPGTPMKMDLKAFVTVFPFMLKGAIFKKSKHSPFFGQDGKTPIVQPTVLTLDERERLRNKVNEIENYQR